MSTEIQKTDSAQPTVRPRVDIYENDAEYLVVTDVPGVAKDAVDIRFEANELNIQAARATESTGTLLAHEYRPLGFSRAFTLPDGVDADAIEARLDRGVLTIKLPKVAAKRPRKIPIA